MVQVDTAATQYVACYCFVLLKGRNICLRAIAKCYGSIEEYTMNIINLFISQPRTYETLQSATMSMQRGLCDPAGLLYSAKLHAVV